MAKFFTFTSNKIWVITIWRSSRGARFKLTQTTTVRQYQYQVDTMSNRFTGSPKNFLLICFISGLKPHICRDVQALQPINLRQAIDLVKLQEDKYSKLWKFNRCSSNNTYLSYHSSTNLTSTSYPPLLPEPQNHIPIKKLSTSQLQEQREKGLCYNCNEKFLPGHKCKGKDFLLVHQNDTLEEIPSYSPESSHSRTFKLVTRYWKRTTKG